MSCFARLLRIYIHPSRDLQTAMNQPRSFVPTLLALAGLIIVPTAQAASFNWPSAACPGTLQACINSAAPGDEIQIVTEAPILETVSVINKSLRLYARGSAARFGPGRGINLTANTGNVAITLENLWFYGKVNALMGSSVAGDTQSVSMQGLRVETEAAVGNAVQALVTAATASTYTVTLSRSKIIAKATTFAAVRAQHGLSSGNPTINILNNQISSAYDGIQVALGAGRTTMSANQVDRTLAGDGSVYGIYFQGLGTAGSIATVQIFRNVISNFSSGIFGIASSASLDTRVINNTLVRSTLTAVDIRRDGTTTHSARIANNLISEAQCGLGYANSSPTASADFNFFHAVGSTACFGATAGPNDRSGVPLFRGGNDFRTREASPNHNVGSNADQPAVPIIIVAVPTPDFDGRAGRVGGTVDMGAFEFSYDTSFEHITRADNTTGSVSDIQRPLGVFLLDSDVLQLGQFGRDIDTTPVLPSNLSAHLGVWWNANRWTMFNQNNFATIALNRRFFALLNLNSNSSYIHVAVAANSLGNTTTLDHPELNNRPDALPIVTQHWDPDHDGFGTYNPSAIGVWYDSLVSRWKIFNQVVIGSPTPAIPLNAAFNVLIPNALFAAGSHAFRTPSLAVPVGVRFLDHPLLNNLACAHPYVTASFNPNNVYVPANLVTSFNPNADGRGAWAIERGDGQPIPANAAFHVYIDPQQSRRCGDDLIFRDGFQ